jgi:acyl-CoA synthetase (AMP-forming)/AMP-acid ligase II
VVATPGFDAFKFHRWIDERRPTYYTAVPTMHQMVPGAGNRSRGPRACGSCVRRRPHCRGRCVTGLTELFGVPVVEAYGMTEASQQMTANPLPPGVAKAGSVGLPAGIAVADPRRRQQRAAAR